jgi:hypothetical protein
MTLILADILRAPDPELPILQQGKCTKHTIPRRTRRRGARIPPYVDDFMLFASIEEEPLTLCQRLSAVLDRLGLLRHPTKEF